MERAPWKPGVRAAHAEPDATPGSSSRSRVQEARDGSGRTDPRASASHLSREADRKAASRCATPAWLSRQTTSTLDAT